LQLLGNLLFYHNIK